MTLTDLDLDALRQPGPPLEAWYTAHAPGIFGFLARRVGRERAEDLTAQVFVVALESWERYDPSRGTPRTWLFGIATNLMRNQVRHEQRGLEVAARSGIDPVDLDPMDPTEARIQAVGARPELAAALRDLAPVDREVLLLYCFADLDYHEIADVLDLPFGTVSSKMHRIRRKLRRRLGQASPGGDS